MQTKLLLAGQYLVNGAKCEVSLHNDSISWCPIKKIPKNGSNVASSDGTEARSKKVPLKQVVGIKNFLKSIKKSNKLAKESKIHRIKVYYAVQNENKSASRLLKLKKLSIENVTCRKELKGGKNHKNKQIADPIIESDKNQSETSANSSLHNQTASSQATETTTSSGSAPPSCYASEGSTGHLSSLSISSSTNGADINNGGNKSPKNVTTTPIKHLTEDSNPKNSDGESSCNTRATIKPAATKEENNEQTSSFSSALSSSPSSLSASSQNHSSSSSSSLSSTTTTTIKSDLTKLSSLLEELIELERKERPKRLLIFVNPFGGKGKALHLFKLQVRRLLVLARIESELIVTRHANHARETIEDPQFNIEYFDGIICVGGDGMFSELMNGLLYRYNRERILTAALNEFKSSSNDAVIAGHDGDSKVIVCQGEVRAKTTTTNNKNEPSDSNNNIYGISERLSLSTREQRLINLRKAFGGIGKSFLSPPIPIGVIGAGSTDANSFGLLGTNDVTTATLNIILGNQIKIDVCSVHSYQRDNLLRFVSTFVGYGYFGDVIRESEKLRWLGPSRYDVTGVNNLIKNRTYKGQVNILSSSKDGTPFGLDRCHSKCEYCSLSIERGSEKTTTSDTSNNNGDKSIDIDGSDLEFIEKHGSFVGVNAAVTACRCPQTRKGFSPSNHLANGCADLILVRPCSRMQYIQYLVRTGWTKKSVFDLKYVEAYRCRQFEFIAQQDLVSPSSVSKLTDDFAQYNIKTNTLSSSSIATKSLISSSSSSSVNQMTTTTTSSSSNSNSLESGHNPESAHKYRQSKQPPGLGNISSSWNVDGEILNEQSIRVKVNNQLLRVFGTGEPKLT